VHFDEKLDAACQQKMMKKQHNVLLFGFFKAKSLLKQAKQMRKIKCVNNSKCKMCHKNNICHCAFILTP